MQIEALSSHYKVRRLQPADVECIYELACQNTLFYQYHPPFVTWQSILDDMQALPPGKMLGDKLYLGFFDRKTLIAVIDLILGYPDKYTAYIGFFMVNKLYQKQKIGSGLVADIEAAMHKEGMQHIRLAIDEGNPQSRAFWTRNGYTPCGSAVPNDFSAYIPLKKDLKRL